MNGKKTQADARKAGMLQAQWIPRLTGEQTGPHYVHVCGCDLDLDPRVSTEVGVRMRKRVQVLLHYQLARLS